MHDYHDALPGYDERQIWHDGCAECEDRGERVAIGTLDHNSFARAWERAADWNRNRVNVGRVSRAEKRLLDTLWSIQVQLERPRLAAGCRTDRKHGVAMTPGSVPSTERHSPPGSAAPVVPLTPAIRRQLLIDAAKDMLTAEPSGPVMTPVVVRLAALGVDVVNDPRHMWAMSVLSLSLSLGLEPSAAALAKLGAA